MLSNIYILVVNDCPVIILIYLIHNQTYKSSVKFYLMTNLTHSSFFVYVYFNSLHVSSTQVLIIRRFNCINTISGIFHSM